MDQTQAETVRALLQEKADREAFQQSLLEALQLNYKIVDASTMTARQSATAGHVYAYLAIKLNEINSTKFQQRIRDVLIGMKIIKPVISHGITWWKGLQAREEDLAKADIILQQHYKNRAAYQERQRQHRLKTKSPSSTIA